MMSNKMIERQHINVKSIFFYVLLFCTIVLLSGCGHSIPKNKKQELTKALQEELDNDIKRYKNDLASYGISDVSYEINSLRKSYSQEAHKYSTSITLNFDSDESLSDEQEDAVEDYVKNIHYWELDLDNGDTIQFFDMNHDSKTFMETMLTANVNGNNVVSPDEEALEKLHDEMRESKDIVTCPICERKFEKTSDDGKSIRLNGMCVNCYKNYKEAQDAGLVK